MSLGETLKTEFKLRHAVIGVDEFSVRESLWKEHPGTGSWFPDDKLSLQELLSFPISISSVVGIVEVLRASSDREVVRHLSVVSAAIKSELLNASES